MKKFKHLTEEIQRLEEDLWRNSWDGISNADVAEYVRTNKLTLKKSKEQGMELWYALKNGKLIFTYSPDDLELYSDVTIIDLRKGRIK